MTDAEGTNSGKRKPLRTTVITALILFILDAFVLNGFFLALIALVIVVVGLIPATLFALKRREVLVHRALKVLIYSVTIAAVFAVFAGNNYLAHQRAERIITAISRFKSQNHRYPTSLKELVPDYMADIPRAKYALTSAHFLYSGVPERPVLMYVRIPPFGRSIYDFEEQRWRFLD